MNHANTPDAFIFLAAFFAFLAVGSFYMAWQDKKAFEKSLDDD